MKASTMVRIAGSFALLVVAGCSSQNSGETKMTSASGQSCTIDAKAICEQAATLNVTSTATGLSEGSREQEQGDVNRTETILVPYKFPSGSSVEVMCDINARNRTVIYGSISKGAPLTDSDIEFLKSTGLCSS
jgi:hypothetical protein